MYQMGCALYLKEALTKIEKIFGDIKKQKLPTSNKARPEMDTSRILDVDDHRIYQMLIGITSAQNGPVTNVQLIWPARVLSINSGQQ